MAMDIDEDRPHNDGFADEAYIPMEDVMDHRSPAPALEEPEVDDEKDEPPQMFENAGASYAA